MAHIGLVRWAYGTHCSSEVGIWHTLVQSGGHMAHIGPVRWAYGTHWSSEVGIWCTLVQ